MRNFSWMSAVVAAGLLLVQDRQFKPRQAAISLQASRVKRVAVEADSARRDNRCRASSLQSLSIN